MFSHLRDHLLSFVASPLFRFSLRGSAILFLCVLWMSPRPFIQDLVSEGTSRAVTFDPPQNVETVDSRVCVHTRLTDEVEEYKVQRTLRMVREMGASTIVELLPWAYVEHERGVYDWYHPDRIIDHAENQGLQVVARLGIVPEWVRVEGNVGASTLNYLPDSEFESFAKYVGKFAERYRGRVDHIIIWNEPNLNFEWGGRPADPVAYTRLLQLSYEAAHAANPDVIVLNGALAPTLAPPGGAEAGWDDLDYLREMYEAGAADYFDAIAIHNYPFNYPPQDEPAPDILNFRRIELLREIIVEYGDGGKPVFITETGWNDHPRFIYGVRPIQRINYTQEMWTFTQENYPWLEAICIWNFRVPVATNSYPDYFTLLSTAGFHPKPIYESIQNYARGWENNE